MLIDIQPSHNALAASGFAAYSWLCTACQHPVAPSSSKAISNTGPLVADYNSCYGAMATMCFDMAGCYLGLHLREKFISKNVMIINVTVDALPDSERYIFQQNNFRI